MKNLILGIDTGGTNTDAVIYNRETHNVLQSAKALTTHHELTIGLKEVLNKITALKWDGGLDQIGMVNLSTTLATNAIAENKGGRVGLIMIGYDQTQTEVKQLTTHLPRVHPVFIRGGHDYYGIEQCQLDEEALRQAVMGLDPQVEAWAVSSFFSIKNPAHEQRVKTVISGLSDKTVTLGQSLTGELNAVKRAATAALNAGLVLIINRLLDAVEECVRSLGLSAKIMVVKGDGGLVSAAWAREKPIETVVSGPAAGLVGANLLAGGFLEPTDKNIWMVDIGGTTTDLAFIKDGRPLVNANGAKVGPWETMVMAVETKTRGLGGDSQVDFVGHEHVTLGPRRVLPLCRLAETWPEVLDVLHSQLISRVPLDQSAYFFIPSAPVGPGMNDDEKAIVRSFDRGLIPYPVPRHSRACLDAGRLFAGIKQINHPSIMVSGFTPTDALAVLGLFTPGNLSASLLGARILAAHLKVTPEELARMVLNEFGRLVAEEIISHAFAQDHIALDASVYEAQGVLGAALNRRGQGPVRISVEAADPVVLLGAPAAALMPWVAKYLKGRLLVPPRSGVASAVGAAAAPVSLIRRVEIHTLPNFEGYRLFLPDDHLDAYKVEDLIEAAEERMRAYMTDLAALAGAERVSVTCRREDRRVVLNDGGRLTLGATLTFTAEEA